MSTTETTVEREKRFAIIGIGNCGNQVACLAEKKYPTLWDCIYINTSESDLAMVKSANENLKFKIGTDKKKEVEGSGKNREKTKEYLEDDVKDLVNDPAISDAILGKKYAFIIVSTAGGTGSGAGPILHYIMSSVFPQTHFIMVGVLPKLDSSLADHKNELDFLKELYETMDDDVTYMLYDNETTADEKSTTVALTTVNDNIVEDLRILTGIDNFPTPYESIDRADLDSILMTPGRILIARLTSGITEKIVEDNDLDEMLIKAIKRSCHAETDRNKKVVRWGVITFFTEAVNHLYNSNMPKLKEFIGEPIERFNHNAVNDGSDALNFLYLIAAGLPPINDRTTKTKTKVEELNNLQKADNKIEYILKDEDATGDLVDSIRDQGKIKPSVKLSDAFNKFKK